MYLILIAHWRHAITKSSVTKRKTQVDQKNRKLGVRNTARNGQLEKKQSYGVQCLLHGRVWEIINEDTQSLALNKKCKRTQACSDDAVKKTTAVRTNMMRVGSVSTYSAAVKGNANQYTRYGELVRPTSTINALRFFCRTWHAVVWGVHATVRIKNTRLNYGRENEKKTKQETEEQKMVWIRAKENN